MTACGCGPTVSTPVENPPRQPALAWRVATHPRALARMRAGLAAETQPLAVRALAAQPDAEPAIALLDAWAVVADVVSFYTERIVQEGFLRTATELGSVRELARALGYELRPGVAAEAELAFTVEDAAGGPARVVVPQGTPVQSIPGQNEQPQTFETGAELEALAVWNAVQALDTEGQPLPSGTTAIWLRGTTTGLRRGDPILVVGAERLGYGKADPDKRVPHDDERWDFRVLSAVAVDPPGHPGWTVVTVQRPLGDPAVGDAVADTDLHVYTFAERSNLFGWNAPDPGLLATRDGVPPPGIHDGKWDDYAVVSAEHPDTIELDGDHPRVLPDAWLVMQYGKDVELYRAVDVQPDGASRYGVSGRITRVTVDITEGLAGFDRRSALVHCQPVELDASRRPRVAPITGAGVELAATDPLLPVGRLVLVCGTVGGADVTVATSVQDCTLRPAGGATPATMAVTLDPALPVDFEPASVVVRGNAVVAGHGEAVAQVLGSGDARATSTSFALRRTPLTYVRAQTPDGIASTVDLEVDGVRWTEVATLADAGPHDRVFAVRRDDGGGARVVVGDGINGARLPTGTENVVAAYRVGIGLDGAVDPERLVLLPRRPLGIRLVENPAGAHDGAPPEKSADVRHNAPLRVRTMDRAVSVLDHEHFAAGFAGVGPARADAVWDGHRRVVVVTLLGTAATVPGNGLLADLTAALVAARDPGTPLTVLRGALLPFGVRVEIRHDPAQKRAAVETAVVAALQTRFGAAAGEFAAPVTAAAVLVAVHAVPGVLACTMPRLLALPATGPHRPLPPDDGAEPILFARPARQDGPGAIVAAQLLCLGPDAVEIGVMAP